MRTSADAIRSLKKYLALALGPEWEVRLNEEPGAFERPFARVRWSNALMSSGSQWTRTAVRTATVVAYPAEQKTPDESLLEAERVVMLITHALEVGVHEPSMGPKIGSIVIGGEMHSYGRAHPRRIPLWDFDGVGISESIEEAQQRDGRPRRDRRDFMRVASDPEVQAVPDDPDAPWAYAVQANIRMSWSFGAAVTSPAMTVESVRPTSEGV